MRRLWMVTVGLATSACGILTPDGVTHRQLEVAPYKALCTGEAQLFCLLVREAEHAPFEHLFETPAGFDFEWGYEYTIVVEERERDEPIADASSVVRRLDRVISRSSVTAGVTFELLVPSGWLQPLTGARVELLREPIELECAGLDCTALMASAQAAPRLRLTLSFPDLPGEPLGIVDWQSCADEFGPCLGA